MLNLSNGSQPGEVWLPRREIWWCQDKFLVVHAGGEGGEVSWHVMSRGQECYFLACRVHDSPHNEELLVQNVNSAKVKKPCPKHHLFLPLANLLNTHWYFVWVPRESSLLNLQLVLQVKPPTFCHKCVHDGAVVLTALVTYVFPKKLDNGSCRLGLHLTAFMRSHWLSEGVRIEVIWDDSG